MVAGVAGMLIAFAPISVSATVSSDKWLATRAGSQALIVAQISEQDVPSTAGPGNGATTPPNGSGSQPPGSLQDWQRIPDNPPPSSNGAPPPAGPGDSIPHGGNGSSPSPTSRATPQVSSASTTVAIPTGPPPALDATAITTMPDPSESTLEPEIRSASSPSLAASIRLTEQARKQLAAGSTDDAIRTLARAVSIDPGNPFQYFYLGRGYMVKKNYAQAITFLKRAEIGFGSRPEWYGATLSYEGACYEVMGKTNEAAHAYQHAFAVAPNSLMARVGYSRLVPLIAPPAEASASADQAQAGATSEAVPPAPIQPTPAPADDE
jgi:Flp pilus assembly protein TadD